MDPALQAALQRELDNLVNPLRALCQRVLELETENARLRAELGQTQVELQSAEHEAQHG